MNKIIRNEEELKSLKDMLEQDAKSCGRSAYFSSEEPSSYPCLAIYEEIENSSLEFEMDEDQDISSMEDLEGMDFEVEDSFCYDFIFISKQEINELLNMEGK